MCLFIKLFAILGVAVGSQTAPWDLEDPLCPEESMNKMDEETRGFFVNIWNKVEGSRAADDLELFIPSFTTAVRSVCHRLSSDLINTETLKVFLIAYLLIDGFVSRLSAEELAENAGLKHPPKYPIMKMAMVIDSMQSNTDDFVEGTFDNRLPGALFSREVEAVLSKLDEENTHMFIEGILKIATLLADALQYRRGPKFWEFLSRARDFRSLIELAGPAGVEPGLGMILNKRAVELYYEDQLGHTQLKQFSTQGFKLWYSAMNLLENLPKRDEIWEARSKYNWKMYLFYKLKRDADAEERLHRFEQDVNLLGYNDCVEWTKRFTKFRLHRSMKARREFVRSHPCKVPAQIDRNFLMN